MQVIIMDDDKAMVFRNKQEAIIAKHELEREIWKADSEFARKPWWIQAEEVGDWSINDYWDEVPEEE